MMYTRIFKMKDEPASWQTIFFVMNYKNLQRWIGFQLKSVRVFVLIKAAAGNLVSLSGKGQKNVTEILSRLGEQ